MKKLEAITRHAEVSEKAIEKYLVQEVKAIGGICLKYSNANMVGYPDRVVCLHGGKVVWVELKSKGKKPTKIQTIRRNELVSMGHEVYTIDNKQMIDELIKVWGGQNNEVQTIQLPENSDAVDIRPSTMRFVSGYGFR